MRDDAGAQGGTELAGQGAGRPTRLTGLPVVGLLLGRLGELQEQRPLAQIGLGAGDLPIQPRRFLLVVPAVNVGAQASLLFRRKCSPSLGVAKRLGQGKGVWYPLRDAFVDPWQGR
jgi:hypothetical protein